MSGLFDHDDVTPECFSGDKIMHLFRQRSEPVYTQRPQRSRATIPTHIPSLPRQSYLGREERKHEYPNVNQTNQPSIRYLPRSVIQEHRPVRIVEHQSSSVVIEDEEESPDQSVEQEDEHKEDLSDTELDSYHKQVIDTKEVRNKDNIEQQNSDSSIVHLDESDIQSVIIASLEKVQQQYAEKLEEVRVDLMSDLQDKVEETTLSVQTKLEELVERSIKDAVQNLEDYKHEMKDMLDKQTTKHKEDMSHVKSNMRLLFDQLTVLEGRVNEMPKARKRKTVKNINSDNANPTAVLAANALMSKNRYHFLDSSDEDDK